MCFFFLLVRVHFFSLTPRNVIHILPDFVSKSLAIIKQFWYQLCDFHCDILRKRRAIPPTGMFEIGFRCSNETAKKKKDARGRRINHCAKPLPFSRSCQMIKSIELHHSRYFSPYAIYANGSISLLFVMWFFLSVCSLLLLSSACMLQAYTLFFSCLFRRYLCVWMLCKFHNAKPSIPFSRALSVANQVCALQYSLSFFFFFFVSCCFVSLFLFCTTLKAHKKWERRTTERRIRRRRNKKSHTKFQSCICNLFYNNTALANAKALGFR